MNAPDSDIEAGREWREWDVPFGGGGF